MGFLAAALPVLSAAGGVIGAIGSIGAGQSQKAAYEYQAQVQANNAIIQRQNAQWAEQSGGAAQERQLLQNRATVGAIKSAQAASGLDVNIGSPVDVRASAAELGELDALTIGSNTARQVYGYETAAQGADASSVMSRRAGSAAETAGYLGAFTSLIGGATSASSNYAKWMQAGGKGYSALFFGD